MAYQGPPPPYPYGWGPPPSWARPPVDSSLLRPRLGWLALAALPIVVGVAAATLLAIAAVRAFPDRPEPLLAPGAELVSAKPGRREAIFVQTEGSIYSSRSVSAEDLRCRVLRRGGVTLPLERAHGVTTVTFDQDEYEALLEFDAPPDGDYRIDCREPRGRGATSLAVGPAPRIGRFAGLLVGAIASFLLGLLGATVVIVVVLVKRSRQRRRLQDEIMRAQAGAAPAS